MYADIYAPQSDVTISAGGDFYGAALGNTLTISASGKIHMEATTSTGGFSMSLVQ